MAPAPPLREIVAEQVDTAKAVVPFLADAPSSAQTFQAYSRAMASLGWLHLSDLHQGMDGQSWLWPNVREQLYDDLRKLHRLCGPWDVVLFTGDLTQRAGADEFGHLSKTLGDLWELLADLGSTPALLTVPGNHDLLRPAKTDLAAKLITRGWDTDADLRQEFWTDPASPYRKVVEAAFASYTDWTGANTLPRPAAMTHGLLPGDFAATIESEGARLGVLGLNSAFLQLTGADYENRLALSIGQAMEACGGDLPAWTKAHDVCLLMTHHPPSWLSPEARLTLHGEISPPGRFAMHLFGHMHEGRTQSISVSGAEPWREWQAASLFGLEKWGQAGEERRHGYSAGRIKFEIDRAYVRIWPRVALRRKEGFWRVVPDLTSFDLEDDQGTRPEELPMRRRIEPVAQEKVSQRAPGAGRNAAEAVSPTGAPVRMIISYASQDQPFARDLRTHLSPLLREKLFELWDDSEIGAGVDVSVETRRRIDEADVAILLISSDYLASSSALEEVRQIITRVDAGATRMMPVILRPCDWRNSEIGNLQPMPRGGKPITQWSSPDEAWLDVIRGLRAALMTLRPEPAKIPAHQAKPGRKMNLGDIFRTGGQPDITFVEPSQMKQIKVYLKIMGQGLVVEGPSGIGKTTATRKSLEAARTGWPWLYVTSKDPADVKRLDQAIEKGFTGHLVVDDFHHLDDARKGRLADLIKTIADKNSRDAKVTIIGINPVGDSLVTDFPDLVGRFDTVSMADQPREKLDEVIQKGQAAANVVFIHRSQFVEAAAGSFFTLQQLCFHAALKEGVTETAETTTEIKLGPRDVFDSVLDQLKFKYYKPLSAFAATDETPPPRGATLALLYLLSQEKGGHVLVSDGQLRYPELGEAFKWLLDGNLAKCFETIPQLVKLFHYEAGAGVLSAEDPQLKFYLTNVAWLDFGKRTGHQSVRLDPRRGLVFDGGTT